MPSASSISINDATPTAHAFVPRQVPPSLSKFNTSADAAVAATEVVFGLRFSPASSARPTVKVKATLAVPHEQTIDGAVVVRDTARMNCEFVLPDGMTLGEREDFYALCKNLLAHADVTSYVEDLEPVY